MRPQKRNVRKPPAREIVRIDGTDYHTDEPQHLQYQTSQPLKSVMDVLLFLQFFPTVYVLGLSETTFPQLDCRLQALKESEDTIILEPRKFKHPGEIHNNNLFAIARRVKGKKEVPPKKPAPKEPAVPPTS